MMTEDVYLEQIIKRGTAARDRNHKILILIGAILVFFIPFILIPKVMLVIGSIVFVALALLVWFLWRYISKEYEYTYVSGNLDFDVIYAKSSRKHLCGFDIRKCKIVCPADDTSHEELTSIQPDKTLMAIPDEPDENTYLLIGEDKDKVWKVYFEPNEEIVSALHKYSRRNTFVRPSYMKKEAPQASSEEDEG